MDKLTEYRQIIRKIIGEYVELDNRDPDPGVESYLIADEQGDHYFWVSLGWKNNRRIDSVHVFVRLRNGKFWIEEDWTEEGIATELVDAGVPHEDIVLAFQPPEMRKYTDFAAA
jgi:XisI protein